MANFIPFTEQQREQARRTDLAAFLRQCGEEVKKSGSENMWLDHGQKVTIRGNLWFHQYEQAGGDAIDFACRFYGMDYPGYRFYCTCRASRRKWGRALPNHQLHTVARHCGYDLTRHHHALADAEACAAIALRIL